MNTRYSSERGQVMILLVLGIVAFVGITALAVDGGYAFADRRNAQNAADAAALAAALAKIEGEDYIAAGLNVALTNGYDNDGTTNTVEIYNPPSSGVYAGNEEYIQVVITSTVDTFFAPVVGWEQITNRVEAVARARPAYRQEMFFGNALVALAEDGRGLKATGTPVITTEGGGIFVNSRASDAFFIRGTADVIAPSISVVGGVSSAGPVTLVPTPVTGVDPIEWPVENVVWPRPSCSTNATRSGNTMSPGRYVGTFPPRGVEILEPGVYCINGDFHVRDYQKITGNGVVIYMESGDIWWNARSEINLTAPTDGPYAGLLIYYMPPDDPCDRRRGRPDVMINGRADSVIIGTIFAPSANVHITGRGSLSAYHSQFIGCTIEATGNEDLYVQYDDAENYDVIVPPEIELAQ